MIVKMKQATVIMPSSRKKAAIEALKDLGVLHLKKMQGRGADFDRLVLSFQQVSDAVHALSPLAPDKIKALPDAPETETGVQLAKRVLFLTGRLQEDRDKIHQYEKEQEALSFWGDFNPDDCALLAQKGCVLSLWTLPKRKLKKLPPDFPCFVVAHGKEKIGLACLTRSLPAPGCQTGDDAPADPALTPSAATDFAATDSADAAAFGLPSIPAFLTSVAWPQRGISQLRAQKETLLEQCSRNEKELKGYAADYPLLLALLEELKAKIEMTRVESASTCETETALSVVRGYVPVDLCDALILRCKKEKLALIVEEVDPDDDGVPVLIKNNRVVGLIAPVFNLLGTIPGYREYDISPFFLAFFSLFFAMIVGDAGYGALLLFACLSAMGFARIKRKKPSVSVVLLTWLSLTTLAWGAVTGSWFGYAPFAAEGTFLHHFVIPQMDAFSPLSADFIMKFCFAVAVLHLTIAHTMNFIRELFEKPKLRAVAQLGKLSLLYGLYFLVNHLLFGDPLPAAALYLIGIGFLAVILFSEQEGHFFKGALKGFSNIIVIFLDTISMFSDIISYIRLSAVGMASLEIAKAFNGMGKSIMAMDSKALGMVLGVLIIFLGHTLNVILGGLSVVVHGVRLNMLEFSGHLGMEWTGDLYDPFRDRKRVKNQAL